MVIPVPETTIKFMLSHDQLDEHDLRDSTNVVKEIFLENVYQIHDGDFDESNIFIDIGANIGVASVYVALMNHNRISDQWIKVYAYEPSFINHSDLVRNVHDNNCDEWINISNNAIAGKRGTAHITKQGGNSYITHLDSESTHPVTLITLEDIFKSNNIECCDVLKMDIEGAEYDVLLNASDKTLSRIKYLALEFTGGHEKEFGKLITRLAHLFNTHIIGSPKRGGYIYAHRY